ncbi:MAG: sigma-54 dependent transcriptional regulator [Candidatus Krumholzibacteria bacterium]|jgi:transcriptional regulator with AAA-type ATPase domain|nr:sigma-54 dependent transcriptional regulator [Candidatus Krumholzibacteria bacterium]MDP7021256.1 sigma-54 dependent transcriptional regulator [Candidatus Krumholzibacteria bacterium]
MRYLIRHDFCHFPAEVFMLNAPASRETLFRHILHLLELRFPGSIWDLYLNQNSRDSLLGRGIPLPSPRELGQLTGLPPHLRRVPCSEDFQCSLDLGLEEPDRRVLLWPLELEERAWLIGRLKGEVPESPEYLRIWMGGLLSGLENGCNGAVSICSNFHSILHHPDSPVVELLDQLSRIARVDTPVFLEGESGVGKELFARALHRLSPRSQGTFVAQNGGALTDSLIESELFGHSRGSFTGAKDERVGLFELAQGGTFFLDEVGDLSPGLQVRLLRVIQEKEIRRVGENRLRPVDFRLVSATHRDMEEKVQAREFREDLWYRLNGVRLRIPPLRERPMDVPVLALAFLENRQGENGQQMRELGPGVEALLRGYSWPGNVRELQNEIARIVALYGDHPRLERWMLPEKIFFDRTELDAENGSRPLSGKLQQAQEDLERRMIRHALMRFQGNRSRCARSLGISRQGLLNKIQRLDLERVAAKA